MGRDKVIDNLRSGKLITSVSNIIAGICFLLASHYMQSMMMLIMALVLFLSAIFIFIFFGKLENKLIKKQIDYETERTVNTKGKKNG